MISGVPQSATPLGLVTVVTYGDGLPPSGNAGGVPRVIAALAPRAHVRMPLMPNCCRAPSP
jgi:hypothetical protein